MAAVVSRPSSTLPREEVRPFLGKRDELYRLVKEKVLPVSMLKGHTALMVENRNTLKGFLWKVLDKSSGHTVHLVGAIPHRIRLPGVDDDPKWLQSIIHPEIKQCVLKSHKVYFGSDTHSFEYTTSFTSRMHRLHAAHPKLYSITLSAEYSFVQNVFDKIGQFGLDEALFSFLDHHFLEYQGKIEFLESIEVHIRSIERALLAVLDNPDHFTFSPEFQLEDLDAGQWGNFEMFEARYHDYPQTMREDLEERTEPYVTQIKKSLQEGSQDVFAVGIGHYCGARSILAALPPADYEVTRIPLN